MESKKRPILGMGGIGILAIPFGWFFAVLVDPRIGVIIIGVGAILAIIALARGKMKMF